MVAISTNIAGIKKPASKAQVPQKDLDLANLGIAVATYWATQTDITVRYITQADFFNVATAYKTSVIDRSKAGKTRPQISARLKVLDKEFNTTLTYVKGYIAEKYTKANAQGYFAEFGIRRNGKSWGLPADRDTRVQELDHLLTALTTHGFQTKTYGKGWWNPRIAEYITLVQEAGSKDSSVSGAVATKDQLKKKVHRVLNSLVNIIKGNFDETWKSELRAWGYQKEKF